MASTAMVDEAAAAAPPPLPPAAVETFANAVTIIVPPPELKVVVDRTADFVKRVGMAFEKEIQQRNAKNKKFGFLKETNPYHAFYKARILHGENVDSVVQASAGAAGPMSEEEKAAKLAKHALERASKKGKGKKEKVVTLQDRLQATTKATRAVKDFDSSKEPPQDRYTIKIPDMFAHVDIDIIRMTSQFVARNGRTFLVSISLTTFTRTSS